MSRQRGDSGRGGPPPLATDVHVSVAIVGPLGSGKTTLFQALTGGRGADGMGMVDVPDERLDRLAAAVRPPTKKVVPAQVRVADAPPGSRAQRIAAAREADVVIKVVRGFGPEPDPAGDLQEIELDLALIDLASVEKRLDVVGREVRAGRKRGTDELAALERAKAHLDEGHGLSSLALDDEEAAQLRSLFLVSAKPSVVIANVGEERLPGGGELAERVAALAAEHGWRALVVDAKLEAELAELQPEEAHELRQMYGLTSSGLDSVARAVWEAGGLMTFFTAGEPEVRAWPCESEAPAPVAAGVIHSDFEKHFIRAEVTSVDELVGAGSMEALRAAGRLRVEGRDYRVHDGDVVFFRIGR
jgi:ribosome-binding ATPase YchF (GTP1/OBG family)